MAGIFIGCGIGPGDPEEMTLKAVRTIKEADIIAAPGKDVRETTAYKIAIQSVPEMAEKEVMGLEMPMVLDKEVTRAAHKADAKLVEAALDQGKKVVFITLGDSTVYSTFSYVEKIVKADGYDTAYVSGITSFCAAAATVGEPLTEWQEPLHVIPAVHQLGDKMDLEGTYVLMKSARSMPTVKKMLNESGKRVRMVENCGMDTQKIYHSADEIPDAASYFSLIIAKEQPANE